MSGYHEAVREAARETDARPELDEEETAVIDTKLRLIQTHLSELPKVKFTFFEPDIGKDGGKLVILDGTVRKIDVHRRKIVFSDGRLFLSTIFWLSTVTLLSGSDFSPPPYGFFLRRPRAFQSAAFFRLPYCALVCNSVNFFLILLTHYTHNVKIII